MQRIVFLALTFGCLYLASGAIFDPISIQIAEPGPQTTCNKDQDLPYNQSLTFPSPYNCTIYEYCKEEDGLPEQRRCPDGEYFNPSPGVEKCEEDYVCGYDEADCTRPGIYFVPHPHVCSLFFFCNNGLKTLQTCNPDWHWFSEEAQNCVEPNAEMAEICKEPVPDCSRDNAIVLKKDPKDCHKFYLCIAGSRKDDDGFICPDDREVEVDGDGVVTGCGEPVTSCPAKSRMHFPIANNRLHY